MCGTLSDQSGTCAVLYPSKSLVCCLGSYPPLCSLKVSLGVYNQLCYFPELLCLHDLWYFLVSQTYSFSLTARKLVLQSSCTAAYYSLGLCRVQGQSVDGQKKKSNRHSAHSPETTASPQRKVPLSQKFWCPLQSLPLLGWQDFLGPGALENRDKNQKWQISPSLSEHQEMLFLLFKPELEGFSQNQTSSSREPTKFLSFSYNTPQICILIILICLCFGLVYCLIIWSLVSLTKFA